MRIITISEARELAYALEYYTSWLTDNSCGDPDCCGVPYYTRADAELAKACIKSFGLDILDQPET